MKALELRLRAGNDIAKAARRRIRVLPHDWRHRYTSLLVLVGSYFAIRLGQVLLGPVIPLILQSFSISRGTIGLALTGMWIAYALCQLPSGILSDEFGPDWVVLVALVISSIGTLGLAGAPTMFLFGLSAVVLGIGAGLYYNAGTAVIVTEFDVIGWAIGTHRIGGLTAGIVAPILATFISVRFGWRVTLVVGALGTAGFTMASLWRHYHTPRTSKDRSNGHSFDWNNLIYQFQRPPIVYTTFLAALIEFIHLAAMAYIPTFLIELHSLSIGRANLLFSMFFMAAALTQPLGGWLSDSVGRNLTISFQYLAGIIGYGALAVFTSFPLEMLGVILAGTASSSTTVIQSKMIDELPVPHRETGFGSFRTIYLLVGSLGTTVIGLTADVAGWRVAFAIPPLLLTSGLVSLFAVWRWAAFETKA